MLINVTLTIIVIIISTHLDNITLEKNWGRYTLLVYSHVHQLSNKMAEANLKML